MLSGKFKEAGGSEIKFDDVSPHIAKQMLDFIHYDRCSLLEESSKPGKLNNEKRKNISDILQLFAAADKYDVKVSVLRYAYMQEYMRARRTLAYTHTVRCYSDMFLPRFSSVRPYTISEECVMC